jgi:hypothetical protein
MGWQGFEHWWIIHEYGTYVRHNSVHSMTIPAMDFTANFPRKEIAAACGSGEELCWFTRRHLYIAIQPQAPLVMRDVS